MKKTPLLALLAAGALLASCGDGAEPPVPPTPGPDSSTTSQGSAQPEETTYKVVIRASSGVKITPDKTEAKKGEIVTLSVEAPEGILVKSLLLNGKEGAIEKLSETAYSFAMPDTSAVITTVVDVTGDCVVTGDVAAVLEKQEDGSYRGQVTAESTAKVAIKLGGTTYSFVDIDHDHSFGYYDTVTSGEATMSLAGNAVYEIAVHPSALAPITIRRVGALHAPSSVGELETLFNGDFAGRGVLDGGAFFLRDLNRVSYKNFLSGDTYGWELYENDVSFATSTDNLGDSSYVYRALKDGQYVVVDDYLEAKKAADGLYYDDSAKGDTRAYAATYAALDVLDEENDLLRKYKIEAERAKSEIAMPSHNLYGISREIGEGYRYGFAIEDDLVASRVDLSSSEITDEGFTVTVSSWKNYDPSASTADDATKIERYEYDITLVFNADTTLKKGEYVAKYYDETNWNFSSSDLAQGGSAKPNTKPETRRKMSVEYGYGAPKQGAPEFDLAPYFTQTLSDVSFTSKGMEKNVVQLNATLDEGRRPTQVPDTEDSMSGYTSLMKATFAPSTALDTWQYGIVSSSDESVVGLSDRGLYEWVAKGKGDARLQIGNHLGKNLAEVDVKVANSVKVTGYFVSAPSALGGPDSAYVPTSSKVKMSAGEKIDVYLYAGPDSCDPEPTIAVSDEALKVSLSAGKVKPDNWTISGMPTYLMTIDATQMKLAQEKTVTLTITDPMMDTDRLQAATIEVVLAPNPAEGLWPTDIAGTTWKGDEALTNQKAQEVGYDGADVHCESSIAFSSDPYVYGDKEVEGYKKAVLTATYSGQTRTFDLGYQYDASSATLLKFKSGDYMDDVLTAVDKGQGGFGLVYVRSTWTGQDTGDIDYVVGFPEDEYAPATYQWFTQQH